MLSTHQIYFNCSNFLNAQTPAAIDAINKGAVWRFLKKPWDGEEFRNTLKDAISQFELVEENRRLHILSEAQNEQLRQLNEGLERRVEERTRDVREVSERLDETLKGSLSVLAQLVETSRDKVIRAS